MSAQVQTLINQRPSGFLPKVYYGLTRGAQTYRFTADVEFTILGLGGQAGNAYELHSAGDSNYIPAIAVQSDVDIIKISVQGDYNLDTNNFTLINMVDGTTLAITLSSPLSLQDASYLGSYDANDNEGKQITVLNNLETNEQNVVFGSVDFNNDGIYNWIRLGGYTNGTDGKAIWSVNSVNISTVMSAAQSGDSFVAGEVFTEGNITFAVGDIWEISSFTPLTGTLIGNIRGAQGTPGVQGVEGPPGADGDTPEIISGNWWIGGEDTGVVAVGQNGTNGVNGQSFQMNSGLYSTDDNYGQAGNIGPNSEVLLQLPTLPQASGLTGYAYVVYDPLTTPLDPYYDLYYANDNDNDWTIIHPFSGLKGADGTNGYTPYIQDNTWYINGVSTGVSAVGPQGPDGPKGIDPQGNWVANTAYSKDDVVTYDGSAYICLQDHDNVSITPDLDTVDWLVFVEKGDTGNTGATGASAGFGTPTASVDANVGTPSVSITASGPDTAKVFNFSFSNLKGVQGIQGPTGPTGPGVPSGGTANQYLKKNSSTNYDTGFETPDTVPTNGSTKLITSGGMYTALSDKANKNMNNVTYPANTVGSTTTGTADRVIETYIASDKKTWYRKWASGWIEYGGIVYIGSVSTSGNFKTPSLPSGLFTQILSGNATVKLDSSSSGDGRVVALLGNYTTTQFEIGAVTTSGSGSSIYVQFELKGY